MREGTSFKRMWNFIKRIWSKTLCNKTVQPWEGAGVKVILEVRIVFIEVRIALSIVNYKSKNLH